MAFDHSKFLARFVEEAREHCSRISEGLLNLEHSAGEGEAINGLFRSAHTIKGSSRMMKLMGVTELAHRMEDVLDAVRGGKIVLTTPVTDLLFKGVDALQAMLEQISAGAKSPDAPEALCEELGQAATTQLEGPASAAAPRPAAPSPPPPAPAAGPATAAEAVAAPPASSVAAAQPAAAEVIAAAPQSPKKGQADYLRINAAKLDDLIRLMGEIVS